MAKILQTNNSGKITQIVGPVVDIHFPGTTPKVYGALSVGDLILEVEHILGNGYVRAIAMGQTEGLKLGLPVTDLGAPISVPTGSETLGRVFNVLGKPIDKKGDLSDKTIYSS